MKLSATTRSTGPPAEMSFVAAPGTPVPSVIANPSHDRFRKLGADERQSGGVGAHGRGDPGEALSVHVEKLDRRRGGDVDITEHRPETRDPRRRWLTGDLKVHVHHVAADRRENLGRAELAELGRIRRVHLRKPQAVVPEPGARRGEHGTGLDVRVEERCRKVVPVVEWVVARTIPGDFTAARRLLARGAPVRWIA